MAEYTNPAILMSTKDVEARLGDPDLHLLEIDEDTTAYAKGHIPGALSVHWRDELQDALRRDLVGKSGFEQLMSSKGIDERSTVVLYGGNNNWFAAYGYWYFKYYGHDDVRLMDGGRKKWELEGRPLTTDVPQVTARRYQAKDPDVSIRAFRDEVINKVGRVAFVDVRSPEEFSGKLAAPAHLPQEVAQRTGHIPGAVNIPWSRATNEDGTFRSADELSKLYLEGAGISREGPTIAYCRIGERSSHTWVVLHELLGLSDVKNYDGSWTEYGSLVGVPIERDADGA